MGGFMKKYFIILSTICCIAITYRAFADMRSYVWTYEYLITDVGRAEIEHYFTIKAPKLKDIKGEASIEHKLEIEVGMTNHFDFSIYQNFSQSPGKNFAYTGFDLRARFLIGQKNQFPLDPLIYIEYGNNADFSASKFEGKLVLAKDIGRLNIAINPIFEFEQEEGEWEFVPSYAIGVRYEFSRLLRLGFELKGDKDAHYVGIVVSHGQENLWIAAGPMFMFSNNPKGKSEFIFRSIIGLGL